MDASIFVRGFESFGDLAGDRQGFDELKRSLGDFLAERPAFEEGHDDEGFAIDLIDFVDRADVGWSSAAAAFASR